MLNLFRLHQKPCCHYRRRTDKPCSTTPSCPIYFDGIDGSGRRCSSQPLLDLRTGKPISSWSAACGVLHAREQPAGPLWGNAPPTLAAAVARFLAEGPDLAPGTRENRRRVLRRLQSFFEGAPRPLCYLSDIQFADLTDFCSSWTKSGLSKTTDLKIIITFLKYCERTSQSSRYLGEGLRRTLNWPTDSVAPMPFTDSEFESLWRQLDHPNPPVGPPGCPLESEIAVFFYLLRYTGLSLKAVLTLETSRVRGCRLLAYRRNNGAEIWMEIPKWLAAKLGEIAHKSPFYYFCDSTGTPRVSMAKWMYRLRKVLDQAGLPRRSPRHFRHHFAIEQLLNGTPPEIVSRLLGHTDVRAFLARYGAWRPSTQSRLEQHQRLVWEYDPLHKRMSSADESEKKQGAGDAPRRPAQNLRTILAREQTLHPVPVPAEPEGAEGA